MQLYLWLGFCWGAAVTCTLIAVFAPKPITDSDIKRIIQGALDNE